MILYASKLDVTAFFRSVLEPCRLRPSSNAAFIVIAFASPTPLYAFSSLKVSLANSPMLFFTSESILFANSTADSF